uniref:Transcription activator mbf2 n=1 Tax=Anopheles epiroticus TaxID=199890 RepID=A0A182PQ54_9DIPT
MSFSVGLLFLVGFTLLGSAICTPVAEQTVRVSLETVADLETFRKANPDLVVTPLVARPEAISEGASARQQIVYSVGAHSAGERLVGLTSNQQSWPTPQDVRLNLQYPTAGVGAVVTYVEVVVQQSTSQGRGYVVSGGVGQRTIRLVIEAYGTNYFDYTAAIYGF